MLERIVENWLTNAGEKGYQTPFTQLLAVEGHRVLHGPVHHPFEHGKDIVTYDEERRLCGFQLKGGDQSLSDIEAIVPQLLALASGAVTYPGVEPPRRPDAVFLVVSGTLTPPARDRLANVNHSHRTLNLPQIEVIEKEQLLTRFMAAQGQYLPSTPTDISTLLKFYLADGHATFPVHDLIALLADVLIPKRANASPSEYGRAIASSVVLTAYAVAPWERVDNHLPAAEAWLALASQILKLAGEKALPEAVWRQSYELAYSAGRGHLMQLLDEAVEASDLIIPDFVEGVVYPTRALLVSGYIAAFFIAERSEGKSQEIAEKVRTLLLRELPYVKVMSEGGGVYALILGTALELLGEPLKGRTLVASYAAGLAKANQEDSSEALADPYHSFDDVLRRLVGADVDSPDEKFSGSAYTLHVMIDWLARRHERIPVSQIWPLVTRLTLCEFRPSAPIQYLSLEDSQGILHMWQADAPGSWTTLKGAASEFQESELPEHLWQNLEFLPYLLLLLPYRLTSATAKAVEYLIGNEVSLSLDRSMPGQLASRT